MQLIHVPATRDGSAVTRQALRQLLKRLERSGDFAEETRTDIHTANATLQDLIEGLPALEWVSERLTENWGKLHTAPHLKQPRLAVLSQDFTQLLRSLIVRLSPGPDGRDRGLDELSEGQTSLFFLALAATLAQLESELGRGDAPDGFSDIEVSAPALRIYAVEEPENHLAPFYLSRLMGLLAELCDGAQAMGLVTSHAPSVLRRVQPESVRHFRLDLGTLATRVNAIRLPDGDEEAAKYVRQAVLAQPEIYFANLVILGEGDSEEIVLPRIAEALEIDLDPAFIAFAPLGGRHVNHFWRLLSDLGIPYLTLLDFDLGRHGAGPLRLKYAYDQLGEIGAFENPDWINGDPSTTRYWRTRKKNGIAKWRSWLAERNVFYSYPLDLDLMMLRSMPDAYGVAEVEAPDDLDTVLTSVFGKGQGRDAYEAVVDDDDAPSDDELVAYDELFKKRGKPGSHLKALSKLTSIEIEADCPEVLRDLVHRARDLLVIQHGEEGGEDAA